MGSFNRKVRRNEGNDQVTEEQQRLPVGKVTSAPVKGQFQALPVLAWISLRKASEVRLMMLALLLLRENKIHGMLQMEIPVYSETEAAIVATLQRLGWDGRVWPEDAGWPTGSDDEGSLQHFLSQANLASSLVFPPSEGGNATLAVSVERAKGNFFMPPLPSDQDPDPNLLAKFKELCENFKVFYTDAHLARSHGETIH